MAAQNFLIMNLLRLITPEEIGDIATKHNGGKFLSLTDLVNERVEHDVYRDFSKADSVNEIHESHAANSQAKILPFKKSGTELNIESSREEISDEVSGETPLAAIALTDLAEEDQKNNEEKEVLHNEGENMSSFIMIEKARLKRSQQILKQKEIIDLYHKNSNIDVEQIKGSNHNKGQDREAGVLVNKKHY